MKFLICVRAILAALLGFVISGCVVLHSTENDYALINPNDGWVRLDAPPVDSVEVLSGKEGLQKHLADKRSVATWFKRGDNDYLIYFKSHEAIDSYSTCGDMATELKKSNGVWVAGELAKIIVCAD